jgi:hypothetical protein
MDNTKALLAKVWKNELLDLEPGLYQIDETLMVRVSGTVEKKDDQYIAPTTSVPLILTLALFWQKCGVTRDHALNSLREAITEAMNQGKDKDTEIAARVKDVEQAVKTVKNDLIAKLPKQKRSGQVITKDLEVEVVNEREDVLAAA